MTERFHARAIKEGISLSWPVSKRCLNHMLGVAATLLLATLTIAATMTSDSVLGHAFQAGSSKTINHDRVLSESVNHAHDVPPLAPPRSAALSGHPAHRPSVSPMQIARASERHFALGQLPRDGHSPLNGIWLMPHYASFATASRPQQTDAIFMIAYARPAYGQGHNLGDFPGAGASNLSQLWTDSKPAYNPGSNEGAFTHPVFTFNVADAELSEQDFRPSLDLRAHLPNAKSDLKANIPRLHLLQDKAD
jgi:hypothetical protein